MVLSDRSHQRTSEPRAASLGQEESKAADRTRLYTLVAPVDGTVQQLAVHSPGAIVSQAQPTLMVVPDGEGIALDVALLNRDAGFVRPGQPVEIKVEAFPFTRYGTVPGEVAFVSSDAVETADSDPTRRSSSATDRAVTGRANDEQGPVYSVRIKPLVNSIFADGREVPLTPGMAVTAEIKTGKRRVIGYLLDPVMRYWGEGLRER